MSRAPKVVDNPAIVEISKGKTRFIQSPINNMWKKANNFQINYEWLFIKST